MIRVGSAHDSPDESVHARDGSNVNVNRFTLPKDARDLIIATLLALSVLVNVALLLMYRYDSQERDLDRYDDGQFITHDFANLKSEVEADHQLIQAYGLQKAVKEAAKEK